VFDWLKRKVQIKAVQAAEEDIERFLKGLRGSRIEELAMITAVATHWRIVFATQDIDLLDPVEAERKKPVLLMQINLLIKEVQREKPSMAAGLMVWLHTVRAANMPEIRAQGREMWTELAKSFHEVRSAAEMFETVTGVQLYTKDPTHIPIGLEPRG
jgi:hypothetical protein